MNRQNELWQTIMAEQSIGFLKLSMQNEQLHKNVAFL